MIPSSATPYFTPHNLYLLIYVCITIHSKLKLMAELPFTPPNSAKFKIIFTYFPLDPSTQSSLLSYFLHSKVSKKCVPSSHPFRFESCNTAYNETTIQTQNPFHQYFYNNLRTFTNAKLIWYGYQDIQKLNWRKTYRYVNIIKMICCDIDIPKPGRFLTIFTCL